MPIYHMMATEFTDHETGLLNHTVETIYNQSQETVNSSFNCSGLNLETLRKHYAVVFQSRGTLDCKSENTHTYTQTHTLFSRIFCLKMSI